MVLLNRYLDLLKGPSTPFRRILYIVSEYFIFYICPKKDGNFGRLYELFPDSRCHLIRTPLFSVSHYRNSPSAENTNLSSGWLFHFIPNLKAFTERGTDLYLFRVDMRKVTATKEDIRRLNKAYDETGAN